MCPATISASIMAANVWKNSLKNVESDNNKILYENILDYFLQRKDTYFLNKPRTCNLHVKEVAYTIICMTSYYLLICQVKNLVGYKNSNKLT